MKKLFGIIIAALVLLTACDQGAHGESPPASSTEAATVNAPQTDGEMGSVRYQPTEVAVEDCYGQITDLCAVGQWVYFLAPVKVGETTIADWETGEPVSRIETQPGLFRLDLTTLEVQALPAFSFPAPAEDSDLSAGLQFLQAGADGPLWALRHEFSYSTSQQSYALLQISLEGQVERALPLPYASVEAFVPGEDGRLYVQWDSTISVLLPDGTEVQTLPVEQAGGSLCRCADALGVRYLSPRPGEEMQQSWFAALDLETLRWQEPAVLPGDGANLCAAPGGTDLTYIYLSPRSGDLYGDAQGETVKVVDFLSCGVDPREVTQVAGLEDGGILAACFGGGSRYSEKKPSLLLLRPTAEQGQEARICLRLACYGLDSALIEPILAFNRTNAACYIEVTDYQEYDLSGGSGAGLTRLATEILAGDVPDLFCTENLPVRTYAAQGILLDLNSCMAEDPEFSRDAFVEPLLQALELDGGLYELPCGFSVKTLFGLEETVSAFTWTAEGMEQALSQLEPGATVLPRSYTRQEGKAFLCESLEAFVDWEAGRCRFESPAFLALLRLVASLPEEAAQLEEPWLTQEGLLAVRQQLLIPVSLQSFEAVVYQLEPVGDTAFVGYPGDQGPGRFACVRPMAISAACPAQAQAWQFLTGLLEDSTYFPVLREELEQLFQSSMEVRYSEDADGTLQPEAITSYRPIDAQGRQGETIQVNALTPAQAETVMALIGETRDVARTDPALQEIVLDELDYYLAGAHTAEETAANIQSRASVYVAERST